MGSQFQAKEGKRPGFQRRGQSRVHPKTVESRNTAAAPANMLYLQRAAGNRALSHTTPPSYRISQPGDRYEREADRTAEQIMRKPANESSAMPARAASPVRTLRQQGEPLSHSVRNYFEPRFGQDFSQVRVHKGAQASRSANALNARAYTTGQDIVFGPGQYSPESQGGKRLLAHELTHVTQQTNDVQLQRNSVIQRDLAASLPTSRGVFEIDMQTQQGLLLPGPPAGARSGLSGTIKFEPAIGSPYSNRIGIIQIVKLTDSGTGGNVDPASMPPGRGASLRTTDNPLTGVEGGFFTDVLHRDFTAGNVDAPPGSSLPPQYPFGPAATGGRQVFGFKRSDDPADIKAAEIFDAPGTSNTTDNLDFEFETVAKGEDTMTIFGGLSWGFGIRAGSVINEHMSAADAQSATFDEALQLHRNFYVHEPVTFYFGFDRDTLDATEVDKIDEFLTYLDDFPDVRLNLEGFADLRGSVAYNLGLADRRANAVAQALILKGVAAGRITLLPPHGETTQFTQDARASQPQDLEANRRGNRQVTLTFEHTASFPGP
ncbi:MAG: DUF4157 domain-containing protein [Gammaproteobacteria bacterium]|nr:DUF4157 domain-containing protein [Gammaproteobacteria bacterium]MBU1723008.1 DUF4157 domain-containing protein [Gammaproteobacteria bacterium]MBU2003809.1 DUF4157 domain-containing protein [Gammaproteobacteria bacterium]